MTDRRTILKFAFLSFIALLVAIGAGYVAETETEYNPIAVASAVFVAQNVLIGLYSVLTSDNGGDLENRTATTPDNSSGQRSEPDSDKGFSADVTSDEVRGALQGTDEKNALTTSEVADRIGCRPQDAYSELKLLRGYGLVKRRRVSEDEVEWWESQSVARNQGSNDEDYRSEADELRKERLDAILAGNGPRGFGWTSNVVLHVIPSRVFQDGERVDLDKLPDYPKHVMMGRTAQMRRDYNTDGQVFSWEPDGVVDTYVQFFRNGMIESVDAFMLEANDRSEEGLIPSEKFEVELTTALSRYLDLLSEDLEVDPPVYVALSLTGAKGYSMSLSPRREAYYDGRNEISEDRVEAPVVRVDEFDQPSEEILRESLDYVWNAVGFKSSVYRDEEGNWTLERKF